MEIIKARPGKRGQAEQLTQIAKHIIVYKPLEGFGGWSGFS
jgi:hypothetical protein